MSIPSITAQELLQRLQKDASLRLLDVRTPMEFRDVHVAHAVNIPLDRLTTEAVGQGSSPVYVLCQSGTRARQACELLAVKGVSVVHVEGGTRACIEAGLPVVRGQKAISLERQVRIACGMIIIAGCLLAWFVHPAWIALVAFVGVGLLVSGLTDTCGMGLLLARMPWNQVAATPSCDTKPA